LISGPVLAQQRPAGPSPKRAEAVRLNDNITIDGQLDDAAWRSARFFGDFEQKEPVQFAIPDERTEVAFMYDEQALYVALRMHSKFPSRIPHDVTRRDQYGNSEHIVISLDPFYDRRTAYSFSITAGGVRRDYYHPRDSEGFDARDFTYDPVWEAKARIDSAGWTAEMRIPFTQLRMNTLAISAGDSTSIAGSRSGTRTTTGSWFPGTRPASRRASVPSKDWTRSPPRGRSSCCRTSRGTRTLRSVPDPNEPFANKSEAERPRRRRFQDRTWARDWCSTGPVNPDLRAGRGRSGAAQPDGPSRRSTPSGGRSSPRRSNISRADREPLLFTARRRAAAGR
jgi:hypothetical protein